MNLIGLGFFLFTSVAAQASMLCFDHELANAVPLKLELSLPKALVSFEDAACLLKQISYNPKSPKYQGWIRVGTPRDNCADLGLAFFGESAISKKPIRIYWISISDEVQAGTKGMVQIGHENDTDPAHGPEAKLDMECVPGN